MKIAINGFGRIGRTFLRASMEKKAKFDIVAINDLTDSKTLAHLLKYDSIYGKFSGEIKYNSDFISVDGKKINVFNEKNPENLPWNKLGIDIVIESTGVFTEREDAEKHIKSGAKKIVISAPGKNPDITIIMGINEKKYDKNKHKIISNSSCTTNCLAPMIKVLKDNFGIKKAFMSTIHAYTNDQRILDLPHKDLRRARAAGLSIIPTSTGAAKSIIEIFPDMVGKIDALAFRVPVPVGSLVDLNVELENKVTKETVNDAFRVAARKIPDIIEYSEEPLVSTDIIGNPHSCIFDSLSTMILNDNFVKVLGWYDNEWGYSCRLVDVVEYVK